MKIKRRCFFMVTLVLALCLVGASAWGEDFYIIAGGGPSGKVLKTQVFTSNSVNTTLGTTNLDKLDSPQWTYTKLSPTSYLFINYQDSILCKGDGAVSYYQLRVNDEPSVAGFWSARLVCNSSSEHLGWNVSGTTGIWSGLPKGDVNLSIWHSQWACTYCAQNNGGDFTTVTVMEIEK